MFLCRSPILYSISPIFSTFSSLFNSCFCSLIKLDSVKVLHFLRPGSYPDSFNLNICKFGSFYFFSVSYISYFYSCALSEVRAIYCSCSYDVPLALFSLISISLASSEYISMTTESFDDSPSCPPPFFDFLDDRF